MLVVPEREHVIARVVSTEEVRFPALDMPVGMVDMKIERIRALFGAIHRKGSLHGRPGFALAVLHGRKPVTAKLFFPAGKAGQCREVNFPADLVPLLSKGGFVSVEGRGGGLREPKKLRVWH